MSDGEFQGGFGLGVINICCMTVTSSVVSRTVVLCEIARFVRKELPWRSSVISTSNHCKHWNTHIIFVLVFVQMHQG